MGAGRLQERRQGDEAMITGLTIHNFRGFRDLTLDGLGRVNLLVGDNGSGKTALLEAVFLAMSDSPLHVLSLRQQRGLPNNLTAEAFAELLAEDASETAVETRGQPPFARSLALRRDPGRLAAIPSAAMNPASVPGGLAVPLSTGLPQSNLTAAPMVFEWRDSNARRFEAVMHFDKGIPLGVGSGSGSFVGVQFLSANGHDGSAAAQIFSALDRAGDVGPFMAEMKRQFPRIETISVQLEGPQPLLYARIAGQKQQRPLELHSGGLSWLALMLLCIANPPIRIVMIDEIESGVHHTRFPLLWRQIRDFADRFDTQVFATTHSQECLDAAAEVMAEHPRDFAFIRASRLEDGCIARVLGGADASLLLRSGLEVRG